MSPARTLEPVSVQKEGGIEETASLPTPEILLEAIRTGRLRIVDRPSSNTVFCPRMDVYTNPDSPNIVATIELPGVKIDDLSITVKQGILVIRGRRLSRYRSSYRHPSLRNLQQFNEADCPTSRPDSISARFFRVQELRYGHFHRSLRLPTGVDMSSITASLSDGLLTVCWPRVPSHKQISQSPMAVEEETC